MTNYGNHIGVGKAKRKISNLQNYGIGSLGSILYCLVCKRRKSVQGNLDSFSVISSPLHRVPFEVQGCGSLGSAVC